MGFFAAIKRLPMGLSPAGMTWEDWKPILRSALAAWIGLLFMLIPRTLTFLGQASYLLLIVASADPPNGPIVKVVYDSAYNLLYAALSWAWYIAASKAATNVRPFTYTDPVQGLASLPNFQCTESPSTCFQDAIFSGQFVEAKSSLVFGVFFFIAVAFFLYLKVTIPTRPIPVILGLVSAIVPMAYGPLFPYFYPTLGKMIFYPFAVQSVVNIVCAVVLWPRSMNHAYIKKVQGLLSTIEKITRMQQQILHTDPRDHAAWDKLEIIKDEIRSAKSGFAAFGPIEALLVREFQYGRLGAENVRSLTMSCRDIILKFGGLSIFYDLVTQQMSAWHEKTQDDSHSSTPAAASTDLLNPQAEDDSNEGSGAVTPVTPYSVRNSREDLSRGAVAANSHDELDLVSEKLTKDPTRKSRRKHAHFKIRSPGHHLHNALHHQYKPVGVFEMHHYGERESKFPRQNEAEFLLKMLGLVSSSTTGLFAAIQLAITTNRDFLDNVNKDRFVRRVFLRRPAPSCVVALRNARDSLQSAVEDFSTRGRLKQLEPFDHVESHAYGKIPHRPLLRMFYLEFIMIRIGETTLKMTQKCLDLELQSSDSGWHLPSAFFAWDFHSLHELSQAPFVKRKKPYDEDIEDEMMEEEDPYQTEIRDPDHGPPRHWYHLLGAAFISTVRVFSLPAVRFAIKGAILVSLISLPAHLRRSAGWFYHQRGVWAVIMASFTQAPFTGDTIFSFIWRAFGTFVGALFACALWYIGDGGGQGQPFGLAAVMAVAFVLLMYIRIRWVVINPQPAIFLVITNSLIIGYSWQDAHLPTAASVGVGFSAAWRRMVVVLIGICAVFIWSFLPKPTTGRQVIRRRLAAGTFEIGNIFVRISNWARNPQRKRSEEEEIRRMVVKANNKLLIITQRLQFASYEPPIQGPWPRAKYERLLTLQREILDLLSSFVANLTYMDPAWTEPMLRRTGWYDRELVGDCLAVIFMAANAVKTGVAVPQTVPSPLIDRFYERMERLQETQAEGSLPRVITRETMEDPGYASFAVGSVVTFAIISRIDSLLFITKELVGEFWHTTHFAADASRYRQLSLA